MYEYCDHPVLIHLTSSSPLFRERVCNESELTKHCQPELVLGLQDPGIPGEQCKVLATIPGKDQPCCYKDKGGPLNLNEGVCFEELNVARRTDQDSCRVGERYPEVKMVGKNCTIALKDPDEGDARCYEFYMPDNAEKYLYRTCVHPHDICQHSVKHSCKERQQLIQFAWCAPILIITVALLLRYRTSLVRPETNRN